MNKPINLNRLRKTRAQADQRTKADENSARFGRTKAGRLLEATKNAKAAKMLDQHELEDE